MAINSANHSLMKLFTKARNLIVRVRLDLQLQIAARFELATLATLERQIVTARPQEIPKLLHNIPLDLFGVLLLDIPARYPNIKHYFPSMPPIASQDLWTGTHGIALLAQSLAFIKTLVSGYTELTQKDIGSAQVLDFGCGWGRLIRLLYKYVPSDQIYAVDSMDKSIELCQQYNVKANLAVCDILPANLPFQQQFDLIFAFSVFTHLSEKTATAVLYTLRKYISQQGLLVITIRPKLYWSSGAKAKDPVEITRIHDETGFAFIPHEIEPIAGDIPYGDTSISLDYLRQKFPQWQVVKTVTNAIDPYQTVLFLRPI